MTGAPLRKILNLSPNHFHANSVFGGGERYVDYLQHALVSASKARNTEIAVASPKEPMSDSALRSRILENDVVVVHQCLTKYGIQAASMSKMLGKKVIGFHHGAGKLEVLQSKREFSLIFDIIIAYSDFQLATFHNLAAPKKIIYGPLQTDLFPPGSVARRNRSQVLTIGRILPHKGFDLIIRALPRNLHLLIVGQKTNQRYLRYLKLLAWRTRRNVTFLHDATDEKLLGLLHTSGAYIQASQHVDYKDNFIPEPELLGLAALEALSTGLLTFVSRTGALPELQTISGCYAFNDENELSKLFENYQDGTLFAGNPDEMHNEVREKYGYEQFGISFLDALAEPLTKS